MNQLLFMQTHLLNWIYHHPIPLNNHMLNENKNVFDFLLESVGFIGKNDKFNIVRGRGMIQP